MEVFFDVSDLHISDNTREYQGESFVLTCPKIPSSLVGNVVGKVVRFRRVSDSTESPNDLTFTSRSSPRIPDSVPPP